jgi:hypothetical protein
VTPDEELLALKKDLTFKDGLPEEEGQYQVRYKVGSSDSLYYYNHDTFQHGRWTWKRDIFKVYEWRRIILVS